MPIWLIIGIAGATWWATNYLAPKIHKTFEAQRVKSELTIQRLNGLNDITRELFKNITIFNEYIATEKAPPNELSEKINRQFTELTWRTVETRSILKSERSQSILDNYRDSLVMLRASFNAANDSQTALALLEKTEAFAIRSVELSDELLRVSLD